MLLYKNATEAYQQTLENIHLYGIKFDNTKAIFNHGFYIQNPMDNEITDYVRGWKKSYAEAEWQWYLSKDPSILEIGKRAPIWKQHQDSLGMVNSNYGAQMNRNNQFNYVLSRIALKQETRHAWLTIYDAKDHEHSPFTNNGFKKDTPCTISLGFQYYNNCLNMTVLMRSNDIHFGFCNDQYCFSKIFEMVCKNTGLEMGTYYHWAANMHLYIP